MKQFAKIAAVLLAALFMASAFTACSDGSESGSGDRVVCTLVCTTDSSHYFVFYADKTVEEYDNGKLAEIEGGLIYDNAPTKPCTVSIKSKLAGDYGPTLMTFTVTEDDKGICAMWNGLLEYRLKSTSKDDDDDDDDYYDDIDNVICAWVQSDDESNGYMFYSNNTVEVFLDDELDGRLSYTGKPTVAGTVTIQTVGTFTVKVSNGTVTATNNSTKKVYRVITPDDDEWGESSSGGGSSSSDWDGPSTSRPENPSAGDDSKREQEIPFDEDYYYDLDNVICIWVQTDNDSNGYAFYENGTVARIWNDDFDTLFYYDGDPLNGDATIRGVGIFIGESDRIDIGDDEWVWRHTIATDYNSGTQYRVITPDDDEWWEDVVTESGGGYSENPDW